MTFTADMQEDYLLNIRNGMRRGSAAEAIGLTRPQVFGFIAENPAFEMRVLDAEGEATEKIEEALWQAGASGNASAAKMWLDREDSRLKRKARPSAGDDLAAALAPDSEESASSADDVQDFLNGL